jgi:hypothetical protein
MKFARRPLPETQIVGKPGKVVKGERFFAEVRDGKRNHLSHRRRAGRVPVRHSATVPLGIVSFLLTPQDPKRKILATFSEDFRFARNRGAGSEKVCATCQRVRAALAACRNRVRVLLGARRKTGEKKVQYLPGWTVQCINPECAARGHWLRAVDAGGELCSNCSAPLHNVPPPLAPRLRMRPRSLGSYRPSGRPSGRPR